MLGLPGGESLAPARDVPFVPWPIDAAGAARQPGRLWTGLEHWHLLMTFVFAALIGTTIFFAYTTKTTGLRDPSPMALQPPTPGQPSQAAAPESVQAADKGPTATVTTRRSDSFDDTPASAWLYNDSQATTPTSAARSNGVLPVSTSRAVGSSSIAPSSIASTEVQPATTTSAPTTTQAPTATTSTPPTAPSTTRPTTTQTTRSQQCQGNCQQ